MPPAAKRILFHTYHFPPVGGSGAQRPLKMAVELTELGFELVVVTRPADPRAERWAPEDRSLLAEIPETLDIRRVSGAPEPSAAARWRPIAERWLGVEDRWTQWWVESSTELGAEAGADCDLVYVWMQPYASAEAGARLAARLGKPWVADLGDPWALDEMMIFPSALHERRALARMERLLGTASAIVMSTPEAVERLAARFPRLADRPLVAIPNGFDPANFAAPAPERADGGFRIVHTGYLHTELGLQQRRRRRLARVLGGSAPGVEILTRSHLYLLEAVARVLDRDPAAQGVLEVHLAGVLSDPDLEAVEPYDFVTLHGYVSHAESIGLMQSADLLFLPMQNLPAGVRATIVPGKTYDYLASGAPILAAVPEGDARDILLEAGNATVVRPDDVEGLAAAIEAALERFRNGERPQPPKADVVARFEYPRLARQLASVFDTVLGAPTRELSAR